MLVQDSKNQRVTDFDFTIYAHFLKAHRIIAFLALIKESDKYLLCLMPNNISVQKVVVVL